MPFQPKGLTQKTLKRLAKRLHRALDADSHAHQNTTRTLARSQEILARTFCFSNWHEAIDLSLSDIPTREFKENTPMKDFTGVRTDEDLTTVEAINLLLDRLADNDILKLTEALLNLYSGEKYASQEGRDLLGSIPRVNPGLIDLLNFETEIVFPVLLIFLTQKCWVLGRRGLALGLLAIEVSQQYPVSILGVASASDAHYKTIGLERCLYKFIDGLHTLHQITPIRLDDSTVAWQTRWSALTDFSVAAKHGDLIAFCRWFQMGLSPTQTTSRVGLEINKIMAVLNPRQAIKFNIFWQNDRYNKAMELASDLHEQRYGSVREQILSTERSSK